MAEVIDEGTFDPTDFAAELAAAPANRDIGTRLWFENDRVRVWEVRLQPGERGPFHIHDRPYFWTVVDGGLGKQRTDDGVWKLRRYEVGDTSFVDNSPGDSMIHDFENAGDSEIRFITVDLLG